MIGLWSPWEMWSFLNLQVRLRMFSIVIIEWIDRTFNMYGINRTVAINNTSHAGLFRKLTSYGILIFNCNLALTRSTLSHCRGDSLFKPLIIRAFCSPNLNRNLTMLLSWAQLNTQDFELPTVHLVRNALAHCATLSLLPVKFLA